ALEGGPQLRLAPLALAAPLLLLVLALAPLLTGDLAQADPAAVDLHADALAGQLSAGRHQPVAVALQVAAAGDQQLPAQAVGGAVDRLDVQLQAAAGQLLTGQLKG